MVIRRVLRTASDRVQVGGQALGYRVCSIEWAEQHASRDDPGADGDQKGGARLAVSWPGGIGKPALVVATRCVPHDRRGPGGRRPSGRVSSMPAYG